MGNIVTLEGPVGLNHFELGAVLGVGAIAQVFLGWKKLTGDAVAIKSIDKANLLQHEIYSEILFEKNIMLTFHSPFIVQPLHTFQDEERLYLVMKWMSGGSLQYYLDCVSPFSEKEVKFFTACLLLAVEHMHEKGIVHRDIKPANILLDSRGYPSITDFDIAAHVKTDDQGKECMLTGLFGTPYFIAPEVYQGALYGKSADLWSLGSTVFTLLAGMVPFPREDCFQPKWNRLPMASPELISFLRSLLQIAEARPSLEELIEHPWLADVDWESLRERTAIPPFQPKTNKLNVDESVMTTLNFDFSTSKKKPKEELTLQQQSTFRDWDWNTVLDEKPARRTRALSGMGMHDTNKLRWLTGETSLVKWDLSIPKTLPDTNYHAMYVIHLSKGTDLWVLNARFSHLRNLKDRLKKHVHAAARELGIKTPKFPEFRFQSTKFNLEQTERRRKELESYFQAILALPITKHQDVKFILTEVIENAVQWEHCDAPELVQQELCTTPEYRRTKELSRTRCAEEQLNARCYRVHPDAFLQRPRSPAPKIGSQLRSTVAASSTATSGRSSVCGPSSGLASSSSSTTSCTASSAHRKDHQQHTQQERSAAPKQEQEHEHEEEDEQLRSAGGGIYLPLGGGESVDISKLSVKGIAQ
mmetsp:Transcript_10462/g.26335  ORF Transcript_10462/g.26335 Transcript_10462/m.26335 type:complete len:643 (+) Transcript_10462:72-2000(+)